MKASQLKYFYIHAKFLQSCECISPSRIRPQQSTILAATSARLCVHARTRHPGGITSTWFFRLFPTEERIKNFRLSLSASGWVNLSAGRWQTDGLAIAPAHYPIWIAGRFRAHCQSSRPWSYYEMNESEVAYYYSYEKSKGMVVEVARSLVKRPICLRMWLRQMYFFYFLVNDFRDATQSFRKTHS